MNNNKKTPGEYGKLTVKKTHIQKFCMSLFVNLTTLEILLKHVQICQE